MIDETCPYCASTAISAEFVDIGVGFERVTPYFCTDCGAHEFNPYSDNSDADPEEQKLRWWRGGWQP